MNEQHAQYPPKTLPSEVSGAVRALRKMDSFPVGAVSPSVATTSGS